MKIANLIICIFIWNELGGKVLAQTPESVEFDSPPNAPIYVIDGDVHYNETSNGVSVSLDWYSSMNPATGFLTGDGDFTFNGNVSSLAIDWAGTIGANMNVKMAGSVVRVNGKLSMSGSGTIGGYTLDSLSLLYTFTNFDLNPEAGQMSGYLGLNGSAKLAGKNIPLTLPSTYFAIDLPDEDMNGTWDSAGEWTEEIDATVNSKGKIVGTGELTVWDEFGDAYDVIPQQVSGKLKNGVVSLAAAGNSKTTSKIKVNLTYLESNEERVANKSSVSAYGQNRKF